MERRKRPYSIQKRPAVKHRHIYYVKFRDETGAYRSAVSSGCTRRDDAVRWAEYHLAQEQARRENITLAEYARGFWKPEATFAVDRAPHGRPVSRTYLDIAKGSWPPPRLTSCCRPCGRSSTWRSWTVGSAPDPPSTHGRSG